MFSIIVLLCEFFVMAVLQSLGISSRPDGIMLLLICAFSVAYISDLMRRTAFKFPFVAGYIFRIGLLLLEIFGQDIYRLPNSSGDAHGYYISALLYAKGTPRKYGGVFSEVCGSIWRMIGVSKLYMQFLILCTSLVALHVASDIMRLLGINKRYHQIAMTVLCLLPNYAIMSVLFLRESPIAMLIAISLWLFIKWMIGRSEFYYWMACVPILAASMLHGGVAGVLIGYLVVRFLYNRKRKEFRLSVTTVLPAVIIAFLLVYLYNNYGDVFFGKIQNVDEITDIAKAEEGNGGSTYAVIAGDSSSLSSMIRYTPIRIIMFQFSPFVWQIRNLADIIALCFNSLFYLYVWYRTIRCIASKTPRHRKMIIALFIIWLAMTFVFAWGVTNTGTAIRHRDKMVVMGGVLFGLTLDSEADKRLRRRNEGKVLCF